MTADEQPIWSIDEFLSKPNWAEKIDETDLSNISNSDFLKVVHGEPSGVAEAIVVSFIENPSTVDTRAYYGSPRTKAEENMYLQPTANNYFSLSKFQPDESGSYSRKKKYFAELRAIMLDDVGSKVAIERLCLEPTSLIETSEGNYQAIYVLSTPMADGNTADRLMKQIIAAGLCDPGADGPRSRLARLPCGMNTKKEPFFRHRLRHWNPKKVYSTAEIIEGFELADFDPKVSNTKSKSTEGKRPRLESGDQRYFPTGEENPVISALKARGLFKTPLGSGKNDITCPWVLEHSDHVDHGTAYLEPDTHFPIGGFSCFHAHCKHRSIKDLLKILEVSPSHARKKAEIFVDPGEMGQIVDSAERELSKSGRHYQRGGMISIITTAPETNHTTIVPIKASNIRVALSDAAAWFKYSASIEEYVQIDPPPEYAKTLFDLPEYRHLRVLRGLTRQPYLRADKSLMSDPGYDLETGMFGVFDAKEFEIPDEPTSEQVKEALTLLESLLAEFPFKSLTDKSAALCAILTASIRQSLKLAPMFHVRAPQISSGKSFLCSLIAAFASPRVGTPATFPHEDEECRKFLLAELLTAPAVIEFDNLTGDLLAHKSLAVALTSEFMSDRILGASKTASVSTRTLFLSSGNNVGPVKDMVRRCITIDLDPRCETPAAKEFKNPKLLDNLLLERGKYVSAALTMIRGWLVAGSPHTKVKALSTFTDWADLCAQPLIGLGYPNPMESAFEAMNKDPEKEALSALMAAWKYHFGKAPAMVRDIIEASCRNADLLEILEDIAPDKRGGVNNKSLGRWIKRHAGRVVDGQRFEPANGSRNSIAWRLETID